MEHSGEIITAIRIKIPMEHTVVSGEVILVTTIRSEVPRYYLQRDSSDNPFGYNPNTNRWKILMSFELRSAG